MNGTLEEIYDRFYYCLYGCNNSLRSKLEGHLPHSSAYFFEYLTHVPLPYIGADENTVSEAITDIYLLAPFARRMIEESRVVPSRDDPKQLEFRSRKSQRHTAMQFALRCSLAAKQLFRQWNGLPASHQTDRAFLSLHTWSSKDSRLTERIYAEQFCYGIMDRCIPGHLFEAYEFTQTETGSHPSLLLLQSLLRVAFPDEMGQRSIPGLIIPIATQRLFYGCIWVMLPCLSSSYTAGSTASSLGVAACTDACSLLREEFLFSGGQDGEATILKILPDLLGVVHKHYVPVLALQHEQICEDLLDDDRQPKTLTVGVSSDFSPVYNCAFDHDANEDSSSTLHRIENGLFALQKKRKHAAGKAQKNKLNVFRKYTVCSPAMITLLEEVVRRGGALQRSGTALHAVLIVGGPGTGKESLANILGAFSVSYVFGERHTINMAALKPGALVPFAMSGFSFMGGIDDNKKMVSMGGILSAVRNARHEELKHELGKSYSETPGWPERDDFPMLVLDELNSMDHDSQGVLLRFLENAEVVPLGSTRDPLDLVAETGQVSEEKKQVREILSNFLVVGMMNEDPDEISREQAMEFITESQYLKGFVADMLYEQVLKIRRLRPDIKYRMVRGGKLKIPLLRERREDIPVLFYEYMNKSRGGNMKTEGRLQLTLNAMSLLVSKDQKWPGNIRQLQALASKVVEIAFDDQESKEGIVHWVERRHIEDGMRELGMLLAEQR